MNRCSYQVMVLDRSRLYYPQWQCSCWSYPSYNESLNLNYVGNSILGWGTGALLRLHHHIHHTEELGTLS